MEVPEARDADTNEEVKQWQEIAGRLQAQLHEKRTLVSELRHAITTMAAEIHDLKSSLSKKDLDLATLRKEMEDNEKAALEDKRAVEDELRILRTKLDMEKKKSEMYSELKAELQLATNECTIQRQLKDAHIAEKNELSAKLERTIEESKKQTLLLEEEKKRLEDQTRNLVKQLEKSKSDLEEAKMEAERNIQTVKNIHQLETAELRELVEKQKQAIEDAKKATSAVKDIKAQQVAELEQEIHRLNQLMQEKQTQAFQAKLLVDQLKSEYEEKFTNLTSEHKKEVERLQSAHLAAIQQMEAESNQKIEEARNSMKGELESLKEQLRVEKENHLQQIQTLEKQYQEERMKWRQPDGSPLKQNSPSKVLSESPETSRIQKDVADVKDDTSVAEFDEEPALNDQGDKGSEGNQIEELEKRNNKLNLVLQATKLKLQDAELKLSNCERLIADVEKSRRETEQQKNQLQQELDSLKTRMAQEKGASVEFQQTLTNRLNEEIRLKEQIQAEYNEFKVKHTKLQEKWMSSFDRVNEQLDSTIRDFNQAKEVFKRESEVWERTLLEERIKSASFGGNHLTSEEVEMHRNSLQRQVESIKRLSMDGNSGWKSRAYGEQLNGASKLFSPNK